MIDLHLHLDGSLNPENVLEMAGMSGVQLAHSKAEIEKMLMVEPDCTSLGEYLEKFELPLELLQTKECICYAVYELMRDLYKQGLCYAEIRFAPQLHRQRGLSQEDVVQAAVDGLNKGKDDFGLPVNLILCCMRGEDNLAENIETVNLAKMYLGKGVCAVDLAGNEAAYPTELFKEVFDVAKETNVPVIIHAGEAAGPESIREALDLGAVRIGHGIRAVKDEELMEELASKNITLEMCYTSNLQTKAVSEISDYPIVSFVKKGIKITLNTDNMTVSNTTLKREYQLVKEHFSLTEQELLKIALNSVDAAFMSKEDKEKIRKRITEEFTSWLN